MIKNNPKAALKKIAAFLSKDHYEKLDKIQDQVQAQDHEKLIRWGAYAFAAFLGVSVIWIVLPKGDSELKEFQGVENKIFVNTPVVPLDTSDAETWDDFKKKIIADSERDVNFLGTMAYLKKNCNTEISLHERQKYQQTYAILLSLKHMKDKPDMQMLTSCRQLRKENELSLFMNALILPNYKGRERETTNIELERAYIEWERLNVQEQAIMEHRQRMKTIYRDLYNEKTATFVVTEKSAAMLEEENAARNEWQQLRNNRNQINERIQKMTGSDMSIIFAKIDAEKKRLRESIITPTKASQAVSASDTAPASNPK